MLYHKNEIAVAEIKPIIRTYQTGEKRQCISITDFLIDQSDPPHKVLMIPILSPKNNQFAGTIAFCIDPLFSLYPLIRNWPVPSSTAEFLLVRKKNNVVQILNQYLHKNNEAFTLEIPFTNKDILCLNAFSGQFGICYGTDYRNHHVLAMIQQTPDRNWLLISKIDTREVFSPINTLSILMLSLLLAMILAITYWYVYSLRKIKMEERELEIILSQKAKEEMARLNTELEKKVSERTAELQVSYKELEGVSFAVSHDLRTPLKAMSSFAQILLEEESAVLSEKGKHYLSRINMGAVKLAKLMDDVIELLKISRTNLNKIPMGLSALTTKLTPKLEQANPLRSIIWKISNDIQIIADPALMTIVMTSLLSNALRFSQHRNPTIIEVGAFEKNGEFVIYVKDNGIGFEMKYLNKIFLPFEKLHGTEEDETGIGLAITKKIISKHGGHIWAESTPDAGATFYFTVGIS